MCILDSTLATKFKDQSFTSNILAFLFYKISNSCFFYLLEICFKNRGFFKKLETSY